MPLDKKWSDYSKEKVENEIENYFGVYEEIANSAELLYIGKGKLESRLLSHLPNTGKEKDTIVGASLFRKKETGGKNRAKQKQNRELAKFYNRHGKLPKFNHYKST